MGPGVREILPLEPDVVARAPRTAARRSVIGVGRPTKSRAAPPSSSRNPGSTRSSPRRRRARRARGSGPRGRSGPRRRRTGRVRRGRRAARSALIGRLSVLGHAVRSERGGGVGRPPHQRLAHQDGRRAGHPRRRHVLARGDRRSPAPRSGRRDAAEPAPQRRLDIDLEGLEVRARSPRPRARRSRAPLEIGVVMGLRRGAPSRGRPRVREQRRQLVVAQARRDQQDGCRRPRLEPRVTCDGSPGSPCAAPADRPRRADGAQIGQRAVEVRRLREHRDRRRPAGLVGRRLGDRVGAGRDRAGGRRGAFHLRDHREVGRGRGARRRSCAGRRGRRGRTRSAPRRADAASSSRRRTRTRSVRKPTERAV